MFVLDYIFSFALNNDVEKRMVLPYQYIFIIELSIVTKILSKVTVGEFQCLYEEEIIILC
jgi:hypothetical protein